MAAKFCPNCGAPVRPGSKFCKTCGKAIQPSAQKGLPPQRPHQSPVPPRAQPVMQHPQHQQSRQQQQPGKPAFPAAAKPKQPASLSRLTLIIAIGLILLLLLLIAGGWILLSSRAKHRQTQPPVVTSPLPAATNTVAVATTPSLVPTSLSAKVTLTPTKTTQAEPTTTPTSAPPATSTPALPTPATETPPPTTTALPSSAGLTLFYDDFETGIKPEWNTQGAVTSVVNGQLMADGRVETLLNPGNQDWVDYKVAFELGDKNRPEELILQVRKVDEFNFMEMRCVPPQHNRQARQLDCHWIRKQGGQDVNIPGADFGLPETGTITVEIRGNKYTVVNSDLNFLDDAFSFGGVDFSTVGHPVSLDYFEVVTLP